MEAVSHDSINRFLERERFGPQDLFAEETDKIEWSRGVLSVDDSVLDKPYSDSKKAKFIDYFWSGKHHAVVKGINIITLFYTDIHGISVSVNYRYPSLENLKFIRGKKLNFMFGVESNRIISSERGKYIPIQKFEDWSSGAIHTVYLKDYGMVKVVRQLYKNTYRYCILSTDELNNLASITPVDFERLHNTHWRIEQFHRAIK